MRHTFLSGIRRFTTSLAYHSPFDPRTSLRYIGSEWFWKINTNAAASWRKGGKLPSTGPTQMRHGWAFSARRGWVFVGLGLHCCWLVHTFVFRVIKELIFFRQGFGHCSKVKNSGPISRGWLWRCTSIWYCRWFVGRLENEARTRKSNAIQCGFTSSRWGDVFWSAYLKFRDWSTCYWWTAY